jgi:hypothetical protein
LDEYIPTDFLREQFARVYDEIASGPSNPREGPDFFAFANRAGRAGERAHPATSASPWQPRHAP